MLDRQRQPGRTCRPGTERHRVEAGHQRRAPGEIPLHQPRQQHVADGDAGARKGGADEEQRHGGKPAQTRAEGQKQENAEQRAFRAEALGKTRRKRREGAEADDRKRRQQAGAQRAEAELRADFRQKRRGAREDRAQVEGDQHQARAEQKAIRRSPHRRCLRR